MNQVIVRGTGEIIDPQEPSALQILDQYSAGPVAVEAPRLDAIATISAGYRDKGQDGHSGRPVVSRDGRIYLSDPQGRAPKLAERLEESGGKRLTIAFPFNNPAAFVQQRFAQYSATKLLIYGDEYSITRIGENGAREVCEAGSAGYETLRKQCKVTISIYFGLAKWTGPEDSEMEWLDGLGLYRIRTTSRNSIRSLNAALHHVGAFTHGQIAGVPFDISLDYRDLAKPDGSRVNAPVWVFEMRPPGGITSRTFTPILSAAVTEGKALMLPAPPRAEGEDVAEADFRELGEDDTVSAPNTDAEASLIADGGRCDAAHYERVFFASVKGTQFDSDERRRELLDTYTGGDTDSLAAFLAGASERQASEFIKALDDLLFAAEAASRRARLDNLLAGRPVRVLTSLDGDDGLTPAREVVAREQPAVDAAPRPAPPPSPDDPSSDEQWHRYLERIAEATRLGVDLAPYATEARLSRAEVIERGVKLKSAIDARRVQLEAEAAGRESGTSLS